MKKDSKASERRRLRRRHLIYYLSIFDRHNGKLVGQLVDITTEGVMMTSEESLRDNTLCYLRMVLPDVIEGNNQIWFDARVMWCRKDVNPNFYCIGLKFVDISEKALGIIENLIYEFSFQD